MLKINSHLDSKIVALGDGMEALLIMQALNRSLTSSGWGGGAEEFPLSWLTNGHRENISQSFFDTNNEHQLELERAKRDLTGV